MEERVRVQEEFEKGITKVLICTDLMTRGIDVPGERAGAGRGGGGSRAPAPQGSPPAPAPTPHPHPRHSRPRPPQA